MLERNHRAGVLGPRFVPPPSSPALLRLLAFFSIRLRSNRAKAGNAYRLLADLIFRLCVCHAGRGSPRLSQVGRGADHIRPTVYYPGGDLIFRYRHHLNKAAYGRHLDAGKLMQNWRVALHFHNHLAMLNWIDFIRSRWQMILDAGNQLRGVWKPGESLNRLHCPWLNPYLLAEFTR